MEQNKIRIELNEKEASVLLVALKTRAKAFAKRDPDESKKEAEARKSQRMDALALAMRIDAKVQEMRKRAKEDSKKKGKRFLDRYEADRPREPGKSTYVVSATCGFDWIHILVRGKDYAEAKANALKAVDERCVRFREYGMIERAVEDESTGVVGYFVDTDDLEYGKEYFEWEEDYGEPDPDFEITEYWYEQEDGKKQFRSRSYNFYTQEEALDALARDFPGAEYDIIVHRAYIYQLKQGKHRREEEE